MQSCKQAHEETLGQERNPLKMGCADGGVTRQVQWCEQNSSDTTFICSPGSYDRWPAYLPLGLTTVCSLLSLDMMDDPRLGLSGLRLLGGLKGNSLLSLNGGSCISQQPVCALAACSCIPKTASACCKFARYSA